MQSAAEVTTLLFDLDGTLVRMRPRLLELCFMARAILRFAGAIPPWRFRRAFWQAAERMQTHRSERTNYEVFLETLASYSHTPVTDLAERARRFLEMDFTRLGAHFRPVEGARETILLASRLCYRLVLATNPVFPLAAVRKRMEWGGIADIPFEFISHAEVMSRTKPDPDYYRELLERVSCDPWECLMIGNDPRKDLPAKEAGIRTFLVRRPDQAPPERDPRLDGWGTFENLQNWMKRSRTCALSA